MDRDKLLKGLQFFSTVVIPVMTLAVTATLTYLKEVSKNEEEKKKLENNLKLEKPESHD